jgi:sulfoxide reductase heme-binding subunit YedZ
MPSFPPREIAGRLALPWTWQISWPWNDRAGAFSPLKASVLVALCLPGLWLAWLWLSDGLGPRRLDAAIHFSGNWAVRVLVLSLLVTPARQVLRQGRILLVRRMVGVAAALYTLLHLLLFVADQKFNLGIVFAEIVKRFYLTIGFVALLGLVALALTSFDAAVRRMGGRAWQRLHRMVYAIGVVSLLHFMLQTKADVTEATLTFGLFLWLMGYRLVAPKGGAPGRLAMLGLALGAGLATAALEFAWYALMTGIDPWRVAAANLDVAYGLRPAVWVLVVGLGLFGLRCLPWFSGQRRRAGAAATQP